MWRAATWVRWIRLKEKDKVIEVAVVWEKDEILFIVTENGMWKLSSIDEYRNQKRWWSWVKAMAMTKKTWRLISAKILSEEDKKSSDVILISKWWQTIRINLKWMRKTSRVTQWIILTKIKKSLDKIVRASVIRENEDSE